MIISNPVPAYQMITESILDSIHKGIYAPGDQLPSQKELCHKFNTSLMTMRKVLDDLYRRGIIKSIPGKGIFVVQKMVSNEYGSLIGFDGQMTRLGLKSSSETLEEKILPATALLSSILHITPGASVVYVYRLRYANSLPVSLYKVYLPHQLCPGILDMGLGAGSLYSILRTVYHLNLVGSRNTVSAILPDEDAIKYLEINQPVAILRKEQITYIDSGEIIEYSQNLSLGNGFYVQYDEGEVY
jgi:GntR family transcriptional regulator